MTGSQPDPDAYVRENRETLVEVVKHGTTPFVRALALAALVEYGGEPDIERVRHELERVVNQEESA